jgi:hypothetical protein
VGVRPPRPRWRTDLRAEPLEQRKGHLEALLRRPSAGIALNEHHAGEGPKLFKAACACGLEGIVSKRATISGAPGVACISGRHKLKVATDSP